VFLSIGYACGRFGHKHKQSCASEVISDSSAEENSRRNEGAQLPQTSGPLYEELQLKSTPEHQDLVELEENVAYEELQLKSTPEHQDLVKLEENVAYEELQLKSTPEHQDLVELQENVAYGPIA
jgi:hypothetical protein